MTIRKFIRIGLFVLVAFAAAAQGTSLPTEDSWFVATSNEQGNEVIYRIRGELPSERMTSKYTTRAVVEWSYRARSNGMPEPDIAQLQYEFEDMIEKEIEAVGGCIQAFTKTGNGLRQWNYYVADSKAFSDSLKAVEQGLPEANVTISFQSDPSWKALRAVQNVSHP